MVFPAVGSTAIRETILLLAVDDNISNDISASYYNKYRQESRTASPAFFVYQNHALDAWFGKN